MAEFTGVTKATDHLAYSIELPSRPALGLLIELAF